MDVSPGRRILLALGSLLLTWLAYVAMLGFLAIIDVAHLEILHLSEWIAIFALITFFVFALPVVSLLKAQGQIRYWYLLVGASFLWALGLLSFFFHENPLSILQWHFPIAWLLVWIAYFSICSSSLYLLLLRLLLKRSARDSTPPKYNPA
jgi:hypothetical protein